MAGSVRRMAVVVLLAVVASVLSFSPASAQVGDSSTGPAPGPAEVFEPGDINRTPTGGPIPDDAVGTLEDAPALDNVNPAGELVERRTETTRTFATDSGAFQTVFYDAPVNFRDANGAWQAIDASLVPGGRAGVALRNAAGPVQVSLPAALEAGGVRVAGGERWVDFSLRGAKGLPRIGAPAGLPQLAEGIPQARATYAGALPGVDVAYTALPEGVKEEVVLSGPQAPTTYDFTVATSPGLTAEETSEGAIALLDGEGGRWAEFSPPFAYDADYEASGSGQHYSAEAVSLRIVERSPELVVRLAVDPAWLAAPERAWPVVIDPTVTINGANNDTYIGSGTNANENYGSSTIMGIGGGTNKFRTLHQRDVASFFTEPAVVTGARLELYATNDTSASAQQSVAIHEIRAPWSSGQATWNDRLTGTPWASAGGDFDSLPLWRGNGIIGAPGWRSFPVTRAFQGWVDQEKPNHGVLIKYLDESGGPQVVFASNNNSDSTKRPRMIVNWEPLKGVRSPFDYQDFDLGGSRQAKVNLASGNLWVGESDLGIAGTGLDAVVQRFYNSRHPYFGSIGARWNMWPQSVEGIRESSAEDVVWQGGPSGDMVFSPTGRYDGTLTEPHGYRATAGVGSGLRWNVISHEDGSRVKFYANGYPDQFVDRNGNVVLFNYVENTSTGVLEMTSLTDTQGRVVTFERAGANKVTKMTDPARRVHLYGYGTDSFGNVILTSYTDPNGKVTTYGYEGRAVLNRITDPNGNVTTFTTDASQRLTSLTRVTDPSTGAGSTWSFNYSTPWQTKVTDPNGQVTTHHFDRRGRITRVIDALGHEQASTYDANSNVTKRTSASGNIAKATFNATTSNLEGTELPTGATTARRYMDTRHPFYATEMTNTQNNTWGFGYDTAGNLATVTDPAAATATLAYNANGTVASSKDAKGATTTYGYDTKGNLTKITPPSPLGATTIGYDGLSRRTSVTDGKGQVTTTSYDALDRPTKITFADGLSVSFGYDAGGRLTSRTDASGTTTYVYDGLNRLVEERFPGGATNVYTYDPVGNLKSVTDVAGTVTYGYNAVNLVNELTEPGGAITTFGYDNDNNRTSTTYPNGVTQTVSYDASNRLKTIVGTRGLSTLTSFAYDYKLAGKDTGMRHSVADNVAGNTTTYTYDKLDRLDRAVRKNSLGLVTDDYDYGYDAVGNRTSEVVNGVTTTASFNAADQLTSRAGVTHSYDANGNQTGSSAGQSLAYNGADQTTSLKRAGGTALAAAYAGPNQVERISAGATTFTNSLLGVSATTEAGSTTATTRDPNGALIGLRSGASRSYYLLDGLGSVVALTDGSGAVTHSYSYDPYGVTTETTSSAVANPWRYTGQYFDAATDLYKVGARYYQPDLGRWTQQDPSGQDSNAYLYVGANPINFVDPSGLGFLGIDCPFGETDSGGCNGASPQAFARGTAAVGCGLSIATGIATGGATAILGGVAACEFAVGSAEAGIRLSEQEP